MDRTPPEGQPWSLERLQEVYPWPQRWLDEGPLAQVLWTFELAADRELLWPQLTDTSAINRGLGLPGIAFSEVDGHLHARMGGALSGSEWVEPPWQWEYGRWMSYERIYSRGLARYVRTLNVLEEPEPGTTRLIAYTGMVAGGRLGRAAFKAYMNKLRPRYEGLLNRIVELARSGRALGQSDVPSVSEAARRRARELRDGMVRAGADSAAADALVRHVLEGDELALHRLRVRPLARRYSLDQDALLHACLTGTREGLLLLRWDVVCPHCRGLRGEIEHLGDVPSRGSCDPCGIDFATADADVMEITFRVHPQVREVADRVYCAAEPATKHHVRLQRRVRAGERYQVDSLLGRGSYRMRRLGAETSIALELSGDADQAPIEWRASGDPESLCAKASPSLVLLNDTDEDEIFIIEERDRDLDALRPADVLGIQSFRDLFADERLSVGVALDVGVQTILFTDVVGSTRFYLEAGDAAAFVEIRKQFVLAYPIVEQHGGVVVKTIGDAVMAAFRSPADGMRAAIALQRAFDGEGECSLRLRVTLHTGACLAVNLNTGIDYFGTTVNLAAKIQAVAGAGEVAWTREVEADSEVAALVGELGLPTESLDFELSAGAPARTLRRMKVSG